MFIKHLEPKPVVIAVITVEAYNAIVQEHIKGYHQGLDKKGYLNVVGDLFELEIDGVKMKMIPHLHPGYHAKMAPFQAEVNRLEVLTRALSLLFASGVEHDAELPVAIKAEIKAARDDLAVKVGALETLKNLVRVDTADSFAANSARFSVIRRRDIQDHIVAVAAEDRERQIAALKKVEDPALINALSRENLSFGSPDWEEWIRTRPEGTNLNLSIQGYTSLAKTGGRNHEQQKLHLEYARLSKKESEINARADPVWSDCVPVARIAAVIVDNSATESAYHVVCGTCGADAFTLRHPSRASHICQDREAEEMKCSTANGFFSEKIVSLGQLARFATPAQTDTIRYQRTTKAIDEDDLKQLNPHNEFTFVCDYDTRHIIAAVKCSSDPPYNAAEAKSVQSMNAQLLHYYALQREREAAENKVIALARHNRETQSSEHHPSPECTPIILPMGALPIRANHGAATITMSKTISDLLTQEEASEGGSNDDSQTLESDRPSKRPRT